VQHRYGHIVLGAKSMGQGETAVVRSPQGLAGFPYSWKPEKDHRRHHKLIDFWSLAKSSMVTARIDIRSVRRVDASCAFPSIGIKSVSTVEM